MWNYNVANQTAYGFQQVAIDYSEDGSTWTQFGTYSWPLATGEGNYGGFLGPDFQGLSARYVLITSLDTGSPCRGISKIAFKAVYCPNEGTLCDDHNLLTTDDRYNDQCECLGIPMLENLCDDPVVILGDSLLYPTNYSAIQYVQSISQVATNQRTSFIGGDFVELNPGFESEAGAIFIAAIDTCTGTTANAARIARRLASRQVVKPTDQPAQMLTITRPDSGDEVLISYYVPAAGDVNLLILDAGLQPLHTMIRHEFPNRGHYQKRFRTKKLAAGLYTVSYENNGQRYVEKFVVQ
ncbi:MAG: hypothetical protein IPN29_03310 [Saprospiraceae bacterium]|nr:hypothetical protein [Saprospiraceae bacterium]